MINHHNKFLFLFLFLLYFGANAQEKKAQVVAWTGQVSVATNFTNAVFLNFGGPSLKVDLPNKKSIALGMLPSLRYNWEEKDNNRIVTPILGVGLQFCVKRVVFIYTCLFFTCPI